MKQLMNSEVSLINVDHDNGRSFEYTLNKKRAKAKLLKGANRRHLEVELKSGCANLRFSDGAYYKIVLPLLNDWNQKTGRMVEIDGTEIKILEVEAGRENQGQHMDTKIVIFADDGRFTLHAYNGTQNLMVQGKNYDRFTKTCLQPFFKREIENNVENIDNFNNQVIDTLGGKKAIKRSPKPFTCPQCAVKASTIGDLT